MTKIELSKIKTQFDGSEEQQEIINDIVGYDFPKIPRIIIWGSFNDQIMSCYTKRCFDCSHTTECNVVNFKDITFEEFIEIVKREKEWLQTSD